MFIHARVLALMEPGQAVAIGWEHRGKVTTDFECGVVVTGDETVQYLLDEALVQLEADHQYTYPHFRLHKVKTVTGANVKLSYKIGDIFNDAMPFKERFVSIQQKRTDLPEAPSSTAGPSPSSVNPSSSRTSKRKRDDEFEDPIEDPSSTNAFELMRGSQFKRPKVTGPGGVAATKWTDTETVKFAEQLRAGLTTSQALKAAGITGRSDSAARNHKRWIRRNEPDLLAGGNVLPSSPAVVLTNSSPPEPPAGHVCIPRQTNQSLEEHDIVDDLPTISGQQNDEIDDDGMADLEELERRFVAEQAAENASNAQQQERVQETSAKTRPNLKKGASTLDTQGTNEDRLMRLKENLAELEPESAARTVVEREIIRLGRLGKKKPAAVVEQPHAQTKAEAEAGNVVKHEPDDEGLEEADEEIGPDQDRVDDEDEDEDDGDWVYEDLPAGGAIVDTRKRAKVEDLGPVETPMNKWDRRRITMRNRHARKSLSPMPAQA